MNPMRKAKYDEMQEQRRNRIGNQSFGLLAVLLMLYTVADYLGFKWVEFSSGVFIIVVVCIGVYALRSILGGAFAAPNKSMASVWIIVLGTIAVAAACVLVVAAFFKPDRASEPGDNSALIMAAVSGGFLVAGGIACLVKRIRENSKGE
jgi:hypothetical protein